MKVAQAEVLAVEALGWIGKNDELLMRFLGMTGADVGDLRTRAAEPEFLGFILDFILSEDAMVLEFAEYGNRPPEEVIAARAALPGGDVPFWT